MRGLVGRLHAEMAAAADARRAVPMQAYMKSAMPYYGISSPALAAIYKRVFPEYLPMSCTEWRTGVLQLWRGARHREERYAAIALLSARQQRECLKPELMPLLEEMVVTGAWWDLVDSVTRLVGDLLREHPEEMRPLMRAWSTDPNLWKRRVSILCQLGFKQETNLELLYASIEPNLPAKDFFIRKAIGWALRQYAWTDPKEVARYVRQNEGRLSTLSRREALKNIG